MKGLQEIDAGVLVGLFGPLAGYLVWWKVQRLLMLPEWPGLGLLDLIRPELLLHAGLLTFWGGMLGRFANRPRLARVGLTATYLGLGAVELLCHSHFTTTGSAMDGGLFLYALQNLDGMTAAFGEMSLVVGAVGLLVLLAPIPWIAKKPEPRPPGRGGKAWAASAALLALSLAPGFSTTVPTSVSRHTLSHLALSSLSSPPSPIAGPEWTGASVTSNAKFNLIIVSLESVRIQSTSLLDSGLETTPALEDLAQRALVATHAYSTMPHSTKAMVPMLCGVPPDPVLPIHESVNLPIDCLPTLLAEQGYRTAHFRSATEHFENWRGLSEQLGFQDFVPPEEMPTEGFNAANYFGYEDDIMLQPGRAWLEASDAPFFAFYLAGTPHHDYTVPARPGEERTWHEDEALDGYLRSIHYTDGFVKRLMDQLDELGLRETTIVLIVGDHGEGFGEHLPLQHNTNPYETGLRVPLLLFGPGIEPGRIDAPVTHLDLLPTLLDALGAQYEGDLEGTSLLRPLPDRTVYASCWYSARCLASWTGTDKHIHHFGDLPDERFDLAADPDERERLPADPAAVDDLVDWYRRTRGRWEASMDASAL